MKTLVLPVIMMIIGTVLVPPIQNTLAIPYMSPQDLYKQSDIVFYGQVVSVGPGAGPNSNYYLLKIVTSFKNPQKSDYITTEGNKTGLGIKYPQFDAGDNAIFYIQKINGINTISPYSQKAGNLCDIHSFLGPALLPGEPIMRGGYATRIYLTDTNGNYTEKFLINHPVVLSYNDISNNYPEARTIQIELSILDSHQQIVFYKKQGWGYQACDGPGPLQWTFVPIQSGKYTANLVVDNKTTISTSFDVNGSDIDKTQLILSPLQQFKSGISAPNVKCSDGFTLVIKSEDNSPACVTQETASALIERGWTKIISKTDISINPYTPVSNDTNKTHEVVDDVTYLSQTVDEWKNKTPEQLDTYYKKYKDVFYTELGSFLIKDEMKKELERQKIQNIHDDFKVFPGMTLDSLPPSISYDAVVNATDGNSYLLLGGVSANKIESIKIIKLAFDKDALNSLSTGKKPSYANPFTKTPRVVISDQEGIRSPIEPYNLELDMDKSNLVTFYNNSTVPIRIQPYGSGLTVDEGGLGWKSKVFGPNETVAIQFNKTGFYEWNARSPPQGSENWWDYKGGGQIAAFSQSHDDSTATDKLKMAQVFVSDSDIPWSSTGLDGYGNLEISLYESVYHMIPDAQKYYSIRAMQLIPFDVHVVISSPSFTEK